MYTLYMEGAKYDVCGAMVILDLKKPKHLSLSSFKV